MRTEFVDRVEHMAELRALAAGLFSGRGGAVVLDSVAGMGKTSLLGAFAQLPETDPDLRPLRVVAARCHPGIGPGLVYGPVVDLMLPLARTVKQPGPMRQFLSFTRRGLVKSAPELLSAMVPGLGAAFNVGQEVTRASLATGSMPFDSLQPFQQGVAMQITDAVLDLARPDAPVVLTIDDVQHIDPSSMLVIDRLLRSLADAPLGLVLSHTTDAAHGGGHAAMVEEMLQRWADDGVLTRRRLGGLPPDAVHELVRSTHPTAPLAFSEKLAQLTDGHAIFVRLCLDEWHQDASDEIDLPPSLSRVVEARMRILSDEDRELLAVASTQGAVFLSRVVASVLDAQDSDVMERLRRIASTGLIELTAPPAWATAEAADCYRFQHGALWRVVYENQSPGQSRTRHAEVARVLAAGQVDGNTPPLPLLLEVASHLRRGGPGCLAASAEAHYELARSAATEGLSFAEAEQHCEEAIRASQALPPGNLARDRMLVQATELLLSLTEVRWRGNSTPAGGPDIDDLAAEAEAAAERCAVPELRIRTALLRGKTLLATEGLVPSLAKLREAVDLAEEYGDPVALFVAKVEYGRQVSKRRLSDGLAQLQEAERLYATDPRLGDRDDPVLQHARNLGEMQLGISLFDSGHLGEALERLRRCTERLAGESLQAELPIALNYLAQVYVALGEVAEAEEVLRRALDFEAGRGGDSGWHAYNAALLAHLLVQRPSRSSEAIRLMEDAWAETERTWLANLVPIVRNLYAQALLEAAEPPADARDRAARLVVDTILETRRSGMVRSEIAALSLRSRVLLEQGEPEEAEVCAREALRVLDEVGDMPALRTEEVLHQGAVVLRAVGNHAEAGALLARARAEIVRKADGITDRRLREGFLRNVPLNRAVLGTERGDR
ncbi:AAA family ATPase [Streptomyces cavernicola]|uniref:AAA family ATPase n=1 Tax=Streptomyces cavernicola TaxID=3043613 RepID=A0ABT6S440_9ACTN|nr:AAA family ATPase [Streptomyces sp. B-S-A6]MDI3402873.1 AAA family ATPase [Streptomyces sp. B-S-A6]